MLAGKITGAAKGVRWPAPIIRHDTKQRGIIGCNMAFWRDDLVAVNGFDEDYTGWGTGEDSDIGTRLYHLGRPRKFVYGRAITFHLNHPPAPRGHHAASLARLAGNHCQRQNPRASTALTGICRRWKTSCSSGSNPSATLFSRCRPSTRCAKIFPPPKSLSHLEGKRAACCAASAKWTKSSRWTAPRCAAATRFESCRNFSACCAGCAPENFRWSWIFRAYGETAWLARFTGAPQRWGSVYGSRPRLGLHARTRTRRNKFIRPNGTCSCLPHCGVQIRRGPK